MKTKKLLAGVLTGAMVLGIAAVPVSAADYKATQKVLPVVATPTQIGDGTLDASVWWDPNTFTDAMEITDKALTITFTDTVPNANGDELGYVCVYSSSTGAMYGSQKADASYEAGVAADMKEYVNMRGDTWAYGSQGAARDWDSYLAGNEYYKNSPYGVSIIPTAAWGEDMTVDEWIAKGKNGFDCKVTAVKDGSNAVVSYECGGCKLVSTIPYPTDNKVYVALNNGSEKTGKVTGLKYSYASVSSEDVKVSLTKTSYTYNGETQFPSVEVVDAEGKSTTMSKSGTTSDGNFKVQYANIKSKNQGTYEVTVTGLKDYTGYSKSLSYKISSAKQSIKLAKKSVKAKAGKKTTVKVGVTGNESRVFTLYSGTKGITIKKVNNSKVKITVAKSVKAGTYYVYVTNAQDKNKNYLASAKKKIKVTVK